MDAALRRRCSLLLLVSLWSTQGTSLAADAPRVVAQREFSAGEKSFRSGDYHSAAGAFQRAWVAEPSATVLWNVGRSWQLAGKDGESATAYAEFLRQASTSAPGRDVASRALSEFERSLGRLLILGAMVSAIRVDGESVVSTTVYVAPGSHTIALAGGDVAPRVVRVVAGAQETVNFDAPLAPVPPPRVVEPGPKAPLEPPTRSAVRSPWIVVGGGALTLVGAGLVTWSGLETQSIKRQYDDAPNAGTLDDGRNAQARTNVFLGVTAGVAVVTALAAVFVVDWSKEDARTSTATRAAFAPLRVRPQALQCVP